MLEYVAAVIDADGVWVIVGELDTVKTCVPVVEPRLLVADDDAVNSWLCVCVADVVDNWDLVIVAVVEGVRVADCVWLGPCEPVELAVWLDVVVTVVEAVLLNVLVDEPLCVWLHVDVIVTVTVGVKLDVMVIVWLRRQTLGWW